MTGLLARQRTMEIAAPAVRPLAPADVATLRLPGRRGSESMIAALRTQPGRSVWIPETLEYALVGSWRNRPEIASIDDMVAIRNIEPLLCAAFERCVERGDELMLALELETHRGASRYERAGLELLEEVITYEIDVHRVPRMPRRHLWLSSISADDADAIDRVTALDQAAFPWLWRNSRAEFDVYLDTPGVEVSFLMSDGAPVAYVGTTFYSGWGHLDRIAVAPDLQGRGLGRAALILAIDGLRTRGARRVGLSTQRSNYRSQRLYERLGFERTSGMDYQLYGIWGTANQAASNPSR